MAERYERVFTLEKNLYAAEAPVIISAGALLKDHQTGNIFTQLKLTSVHEGVIRALRVSVQPMDLMGQELGDPISYRYLDLSACRDADFGQKTLIPLPDRETRTFRVCVTEAVFSDGAVWEGGGIPERLPDRKPIRTYLPDAELLNEYRTEFGENCEFQPEEAADLWYCACGAINRESEGACHRCKKSRAALFSVDLEALEQKKDARLKREAEKRAAEEAAEAAAAKKRKRIFTVAAVSIAACVAVVLLTVKVIIPIVRYCGAVSLMNDGKYEEAISSFEALNGYKDSTEKISACQTALKDIEYNAAVVLMDDGKYDEAITAFEAMDGYKDSTEKISLCQTTLKDIDYNAAVDLMNDGKYEEAISAFEALNGYKDSKDKASECLFLLQKSNLADIKKGDTVKFGSYEQDNNTTNGKEEIEWVVLKVEGSKALVISKYALDCQRYNTSYTDVTWEKCTLRKWLNGSFLNTAFGSKHQEQISSVSVSADKNPKYSTNPGNATTDKVFLLSITEAEKYFSSDSARQCSATAYAKAQGAFTGNGSCCWWLRSPGNRQDFAASVHDFVSVFCYGDGVNEDDVAVRPALWISIE